MCAQKLTAFAACNQKTTRSQHIWQQRNVARQLINMWLTAMSSLFDRVTADMYNKQQQLNSALHIDKKKFATI